VEKKLKDAEKQMKDHALKAYINPELSAEEKEKGNALVKDGNYIEAKAAYDEVCMCLCLCGMCVCVREREREKATAATRL